MDAENKNGTGMEPVVRLRDVSISHAEGTLLSHVNLELRAGEFAYLIGKSGTGKTSLLRALYADKAIDSGEAQACGYNLQHLRRRDIPMLRRKIGIAFQNFRLLMDRDVYENLRFVLRATGWKNGKQMDERIDKALRWVGMASKAHASPHRLSEGEQQRVGVARALINAPTLLLADEPTGNLDPITSQEIMSMLLELNRSQGVTMLISTHDFMTVEKYPARVLCCENGTLVEEH